MLAALIVASPAGTRAQRYQTQQVAIPAHRAQQVPARLTAIQVPGPAPGTAITKVCIETVGRMAYVALATGENPSQQRNKAACGKVGGHHNLQRCQCSGV